MKMIWHKTVAQNRNQSFFLFFFKNIYQIIVPIAQKIFHSEGCLLIHNIQKSYKAIVVFCVHKYFSFFHSSGIYMVVFAFNKWCFPFHAYIINLKIILSKGS